MHWVVRGTGTPKDREEVVWTFFCFLINRSSESQREDLTYVCRCDERLKSKTSGGHRVVYYESIKRDLNRTRIHSFGPMLILLQQNKKRRESGGKCHSRNYDAQ
jgi:hypothetical protein